MTRSQKLRRRNVLAVAAGVAAGWPMLGKAQAQRVCKFLVGFPPGGSTDIVARLVAAQSKGFADAIVVENLVGAAGRIAVMRVKSSEPDGSTVLVSPGDMMTLYPHVYRKLAYDPMKDFVPVIQAGTMSFSLVVSNAVVPAQVRTLVELGDWLRSNPKMRSFASGGTGTPMHFVGVMLAKHLDMDLTHVAYRGAPPMLQDLAGGQIALGVTTVGDALPHIEGGKLRAIAVSSSQRSSFLPQAPTFAELGAQQIVAYSDFGLYLPIGASPEIVQRLATAVRQSLGTPEVKAGLDKMACTPTGSSPAEFRQILESDLARWQPVVKASGFSLDE